MNGLNWWESLSFVLWKLVYIVHQSLWFPKSKVFLQYSPFQINFGQCSWACFFPTHWCSSKSTTFQICRVRHLLKLLLQCLVQAGFLNVTFSWHNVNYMLYLHKKLLIQAFKTHYIVYGAKWIHGQMRVSLFRVNAEEEGFLNTFLSGFSHFHLTSYFFPLGGSYKKIGYYDSTKGNLSWYGNDKWIGKTNQPFLCTSGQLCPFHSHHLSQPRLPRRDWGLPVLISVSSTKPCRAF